MLFIDVKCCIRRTGDVQRGSLGLIYSVLMSSVGQANCTDDMSRGNLDGGKLGLSAVC